MTSTILNTPRQPSEDSPPNPGKGTASAMPLRPRREPRRRNDHKRKQTLSPLAKRRRPRHPQRCHPEAHALRGPKDLCNRASPHSCRCARKPHSGRQPSVPRLPNCTFSVTQLQFFSPIAIKRSERTISRSRGHERNIPRLRPRRESLKAPVPEAIHAATKIRNCQEAH